MKFVLLEGKACVDLQASKFVSDFWNFWNVFWRHNCRHLSGPGSIFDYEHFSAGKNCIVRRSTGRSDTEIFNGNVCFLDLESANHENRFIDDRFVSRNEPRSLCQDAVDHFLTPETVVRVSQDRPVEFEIDQLKTRLWSKV